MMNGWSARAEKITPGGAQTRSKRASAFPPGYPRFLEGGKGAIVWDETGKEYVDWVLGLASISLGYGFPAVDLAVMKQLDHGISFSLPTTLEIETAEVLCEALQAEQIRFVKTGSEATEGAMRIARLATGRDLILSIGYHGWHSVHDAAAATHFGVPFVYERVMRGMPYGEEVPLTDQVAAVIVEPCRDDEPPIGWLDALRFRCDLYGALLIFDEIVTGFRWALRGGSEYFGVEPDLRVYGKAMANGMPLACIVGPEALMRHASYVSGTFGGECLSLAAARATLKVYQDEKVIDHMWAVGQRLMDGFNALGSDLKMIGYPVHPRIVGEGRDAFLSAVAREGVLFHPAGFNVSLSHGDDEVSETLHACKRALGAIA